MYRADSREINRTFYRLRMIVLIALTTGMRIAEIFALTWSDLRHSEGLIAVSSKLKGGKIRYVPMTPERAAGFRRYPAVIGEEHLFPRKRLPKASASESRRASIRFLIWPVSRASVFTISGTRSHPGT